MNPRKFRMAADAVLDQAVRRRGGVPGVVAMATDSQHNVFEGAAGVRQLGQQAPMTLDSVFALFSTTKALTGVCAWQLIEEGRLRLSDPACRYVSEIAELRVLEGFDADGQPRTRAPKRDVTVNDLMLHTAGLSYEFFSEDDLKYRRALRIPSVVAGSFASIRTVLLHDPGERWTYGVGIDWLGRIVATLRDLRLGEVMRERIFDPLGMQDIGFVMSASMQDRRATIHDRAADGRLTPLPDMVLPTQTELDMGGHGLYGTVGEYMKFIRMVLNEGDGPHGRVLRAETVAQMAQDGLGALQCTGWQTSIASLSNAGEFFPGIDKGWAYSFMTNREPTPSGRPAGALMWAGLANCFFWIDRQSGLGGYWATQILPFQDAVSYPGFVEFETAVYHHRRQ